MKALLDEIRALCAAKSLSASFTDGAAAARIDEAERRVGRPFPDEYRQLLGLHDGFSFAGVRVLGTADFLDDSQLFQRAREFIDDTAQWDRTEIVNGLPVANLGQPNDWLIYSVAGEPVVWLTADDSPAGSLAEALRGQLAILAEVHH